jgi:hypothetical protein
MNASAAFAKGDSPPVALVLPQPRSSEKEPSTVPARLVMNAIRKRPEQPRLLRHGGGTRMEMKKVPPHISKRATASSSACITSRRSLCASIKRYPLEHVSRV